MYINIQSSEDQVHIYLNYIIYIYMLPLILLYDIVFRTQRNKKTAKAKQLLKIKHPKIVKTKDKSDYIYYLIDILVSIIAISLALIKTDGMDITVRLTHIVFAIMFRYVYLAYIGLIQLGLLD